MHPPGKSGWNHRKLAKEAGSPGGQLKYHTIIVYVYDGTILDIMYICTVRARILVDTTCIMSIIFICLISNVCIMYVSFALLFIVI